MSSQTHELATGRTSAVASGAVPVAGVNNVNSIEYGRDGSTIVTAGTGVAIVDVATGSLVGTPFPSQAVDSASIAGDGMSVVTGTDGQICSSGILTRRVGRTSRASRGRSQHDAGRVATVRMARRAIPSDVSAVGGRRMIRVGGLGTCRRSRCRMWWRQIE